ncbi:MAG TPA: FG-GAP-like repeat-containing protein, partial [Planctomycetota bacterium]|nr:FG-GAP-like repeat-containing protein [Planctomycetota bacterium]
MKFPSLVAAALLGLVSTAPAQPFGLTHRMLPPDGDYTQALALGDVDGDGDLDAFVGNGEFNGPQQSRLYLNDGTGLFTDVTATILSVPSFDAQAVAL